MCIARVYLRKGSRRVVVSGSIRFTSGSGVHLSLALTSRYPTGGEEERCKFGEVES